MPSSGQDQCGLCYSNLGSNMALAILLRIASDLVEVLDNAKDDLGVLTSLVQRRCKRLNHQTAGPITAVYTNDR